MFAWLGLIAAAAPVVEAVDVGVGSLADRLAPDDDASLVILYAGEQQGKVGPCGCATRPVGGLAGLATYVDAVRAGSRPVLLVDPGSWRASAADFGELSDASRSANDAFDRALELLRFDAFNVGYRDLPSVTPRPGLVSATHRVVDPGSVGPLPYAAFDLDGLRVVVTGVSRDGLPYLQPKGTAVTPPVDAVRAILPETADADLVVVLAIDAPSEVEAIAALPGVDVVIEAGGYAERWPPLVVGDAVWVRSRDAGARVGELRLWVVDGRVVRAVDRFVGIDDALRGDRRIEAVARGRG
ncbi:MAG: hypothetical protein ABMB14_22545, partial [Myxococcota bacterium]